MTEAILGADEFLARFGVGDVFWHMRRNMGEAPSHIEGPCTIIAISTSYEGVSAPPVVTFTCWPQLRKSFPLRLRYRQFPFGCTRGSYG